MDTEKTHLYLYKYSPIHKPYSLQNLNRLIKNNELVFSSPSVLNDPYDCKTFVTYEGDYDDELWGTYLKLVFQYGSMHNKSEQEIESEVSEIIASRAHENDERRKELREIHQKAYLNYSSTYYLASFSLDNEADNLLLWSHYADSHEGYCLQFDPELKPPDIDYGEVKCLKEYPSLVDLVRGFKNNKLDEVFLLRKSEEWKYENECRLIYDNESKSGNVIFKKMPEEFLTGIIYGCRMDSSNKEIIKCIVEKRHPQIKQYEAKLLENEYGLKIVPIA